MYLRRQVILLYTAGNVTKTENEASLCKLDVIVKNRTAVAGSVGFFKLEQKKLLKKEALFFNMFY